MVTAKFSNVAKFRMEKGYLAPIYPQNPGPELRQHILDKANELDGCYVAAMSQKDVWYTTAAQRILTTERLEREAAEGKITSQTEEPKASSPMSSEAAYAQFRAKLTTEPA